MQMFSSYTDVIMTCAAVELKGGTNKTTYAGI